MTRDQKLSHWAAQLDQIVREMDTDRGPEGFVASHMFGVCMSQIAYVSRRLCELAGKP